MFEYDSPIGMLYLEAKAGAITRLVFSKGNASSAPPSPADEAVLRKCASELDEYFAGRLKEFTVPVRPLGTPFRMRVWEALKTIPYGQTITYKELASRIGKPTAARAVGGANHNNPISIIIPCHRVIGAGGGLVGYGGGLGNKEFLLGLERSL